ncbi:MAG: hypothetical protein AAFP82_21520 [Bacteroidota bacterium]
MNDSLKRLLLFGVLAELLIFGFSYGFHPETGDTFRHAARYSGRLSLLVFLYTFYLYASNYPKPVKEYQALRNFLTLFAILHLIHFGFLSASVYLNAIPLETSKVIGGALAYLMIVAAPFKLHQVNVKLQLVYFYYVSLVMALTIVARLKGELEGAEVSWFHYLGLSLIVLCAVLFGIWIYQGSRRSYDKG